MSTPALSKLERAVAGLLLPSESDEPIAVVRWPCDAGDLDEGELLRLAGLPPGAKVERTDVADVFRDGFAGDEAARFRAVAAALDAALDAVRAYRVGEVEKDVFIVGKVKAGPGWAGLRGKVVET